MTHAEVSLKAAFLGLVARVDAAGFCVLARPGCALAARGGSWEEAFARLEATREPGPEAARTPPPVQRGLFDAW